MQPVLQIHGPQHARAQIVAIRKAASDDQHGIIQQIPLPGQQLVDMHNLRPAARQFHGQRRVVVAVGAVGVENENVGGVRSAECGVRSGGMLCSAFRTPHSALAAPGLF